MAFRKLVIIIGLIVVSNVLNAFVPAGTAIGSSSTSPMRFAKPFAPRTHSAQSTGENSQPAFASEQQSPERVQPKAPKNQASMGSVGSWLQKTIQPSYLYPAAMALLVWAISTFGVVVLLTILEKKALNYADFRSGKNLKALRTYLEQQIKNKNFINPRTPFGRRVLASCAVGTVLGALVFNGMRS